MHALQAVRLKDTIRLGIFFRERILGDAEVIEELMDFHGTAQRTDRPRRRRSTRKAKSMQTAHLPQSAL